MDPRQSAPDVYPYYPDGIADDPTHPEYARYKWDVATYRQLGYTRIIEYLADINTIAARQSWVRLASKEISV